MSIHVFFFGITMQIDLEFDMGGRGRSEGNWTRYLFPNKGILLLLELQSRLCLLIVFCWWFSRKQAFSNSWKLKGFIVTFLSFGDKVPEVDSS